MEEKDEKPEEPEKPEGVDEVVDIDTPKKEEPVQEEPVKEKQVQKHYKPLEQGQEQEQQPRKVTGAERDKAKKEFNGNPITKWYGVKAVNRVNRTFLYIYLITTTILVLGLIATNVFWFNHSFSEKSFGTNITIEPAEVKVDVHNEDTHHIHLNATISLPEEIIIKIINATNST